MGTLPAFRLLPMTESGGVGTSQAPNMRASQDSALLCCSRPWSPGQELGGRAHLPPSFRYLSKADFSKAV